MRHPSLKRTLIAAVFSLLVASLLLVGSTPVNAQSRPSSQGIPQQIATLEQQIAALKEQIAALKPSTGGTKPVRVVDANGTEVGPMISRSEVIRKAGDVWLILGVATTGFAEAVPMFYNTSRDCSGVRYMGDTPDVIKQAYVVGERVYYGEGNPQPVEVAAVEYVSASGSSCTEMSPYTLALSRVVFTVLPAFSPPFAVRYDE